VLDIRVTNHKINDTIFFYKQVNQAMKKGVDSKHHETINLFCQALVWGSLPELAGDSVNRLSLSDTCWTQVTLMRVFSGELDMCEVFFCFNNGCDCHGMIRELCFTNKNSERYFQYHKKTTDNPRYLKFNRTSIDLSAILSFGGFDVQDCKLSALLAIGMLKKERAQKIIGKP